MSTPEIVELSWTTYILCNLLGIGYFIEGCRNELIEYTKHNISVDMERLRQLEREWPTTELKNK